MLRSDFELPADASLKACLACQTMIQTLSSRWDLLSCLEAILGTGGLTRLRTVAAQYEVDWEDTLLPAVVERDA